MRLLRLARPAILAADDQIVPVGVRTAVQATSVVVGIARIPVERVRDFAAGDPAGDDEGAISRLLGMERDAAMERRVRRHHDRPGAHLDSLPGAHAREGVAVVYGDDVGSAENPAARPPDGRGEPEQVVAHVDSRLIGESKRRPEMLRARRPVRAQLDVQAGATRCGALFIENAFVRFRGAEEITVHAPEVALDAVLRDPILDTVDCGPVAFGCHPRAALAVEPFQLHVAIVERARKVRARAEGFAFADVVAIEDDHRPSMLQEAQRDGKARDAGADDADVRLDVPGEPRGFRLGDRSGGPDGLGERGGHVGPEL